MPGWFGDVDWGNWDWGGMSALEGVGTPYQSSIDVPSFTPSPNYITPTSPVWQMPGQDTYQMAPIQATQQFTPQAAPQDLSQYGYSLGPYDAPGFTEAPTLGSAPYDAKLPSFTGTPGYDLAKQFSPESLSGGGGKPPTSFWDAMKQQALKDPVGTLGNVGGLGVSALGILSGIQGMKRGGEQYKVQQQEERRLQDVAAPAAQAGTSLVPAGTQAMLGGPLPDQLETLVEKWKDETRGRLRSYFAKAGIDDSTMMAEYESWIDQQAAVLREQYAEQLLAAGLTSIQTATGPSSTVLNAATGQQKTVADTIGSANRAIAQVVGRNPGNVLS